MSILGELGITIKNQLDTKQPLDTDLTAISELTGTNGLLKKTAENTWALDTNQYVTSSGVTDVYGTAPISSSGGNAPVISISKATTLSAGSMSASDKVKLDNIENQANNYIHPLSGVAPGTYKSVTVDNKGHIINGSNPTTINEYGITDAYNKTEVDNKVNTQKDRIDAILSASSADKDSFAEIVQLINSVDTTNDTAFANYVLSNDAIVATKITANNPIVPGTAPKVSYDSKGLITGGSLLLASDIPNIDASKITSGILTQDTTGNSNTSTSSITSTKLSVPRNIAITGDISWSTVFDGSANVTSVGTLANTGVIAGSYGSTLLIPSITVDSKGRITSASNNSITVPSGNISVTGGDITMSGVTGTAITNATLANTGVTAGTYTKVTVDTKGRVTSATSPTTLNGYGITDAQAALVSGTNIKTVNGNNILGTGNIDTTQINITGNAGTATKLQTARNIVTSGDIVGTTTSFDGSANININLSLPTITNNGIGTFKKLTTDTKGRVIGTQDVVQSDITGLLGANSITNNMLSNTAVTNLSGTNTGDQTITLTGDVTGSGTSSFVTSLANSGVTPGTYTKLTVDAKGRITSATNPTTVNGYGITDAQEVLVSGTNIKTVNGTTLLGGGDIIVSAGSGGYAANVYLTTSTSSTVGTYSQVSYTPQITETILNTIVNNNEVLIEDYIFDGDVLTTNIPAGEWAFHIHRYVSSNVGHTKIRFSVFARSSLGVETELFTTNSTEINDIISTREDIITTQPTFNINTTDRIGIKLYASTTRTSDVIVSLKVGDGEASYFNTPLQIRHNQLRARDESDAHPISAISGLTNALNGKVNNTDIISVSNGGTGVNILSGLLKGNGTTPLTTAIVGVDYVVPSGSITGNATTATKLNSVRNFTLTGDVTGTISSDLTSGVSITTTIAANSVALGTDTTGNYVSGTTAGTGITISGTAGEGWSPTIAITNVGTVGTYTKVTTNAQGQVVSGTTLSATDIPSLDASKLTSGIIDAARLPAYVDDVLEFINLASFPVTGESGKIYVALDTNKTYRWSGTVYVYITSGAVDSVNGMTGIITITNISGNSGTTTKLNTPVTINSVSFDGSSNIVVEDNTKQPIDADLTAIAGLIGTTGLLKKTAVNTWSLDTNTYVTSSGVTAVTGTAPIISSGGVTPIISINAATTTLPGSMSASDKTKLDGIATGATSNVGTVTSVGGTGTVSGLSLSGTVTSSGNITLGGTLSVLPSNFASQTAATVLAAPAGIAGVPSFRTLVVSDIPILNQNTTGNATTATKLANINTTFSGTYPVAFNVTGDIYSNANINFNGTTNTLSATNFSGALTGNASTATTLQTARTIGTSGDITSTAQSFNGSANIVIPMTLANSGVVAGSYGSDTLIPTLVVDAKGRITSASTNAVSIPSGNISVTGGDITMSGVTGTAITNATLATTGVTAGTYTKVTVDAKGRVTSGLVPTMEDIPDATFKRSVKCATTANITLSATQTIDGIILVVGDRVLVKNQTTTSQNGIYVVSATAWTRTIDADTSSKIASALVAVDSGTTNGGKIFDNDFKTTDTLGTTAMLWNMNLDDGSLLTSGSTSIGMVKYNGTTAVAGQFDGGATTPTGTVRLNYGGYFYPTFLNLTGSGDTTTTSSHVFVETGSDGYVRPKTLANFKTEMFASPTLVTPNIGVATGTSFNSITGLSSTAPVMDGIATVGVGTTVSRADHIHPSDTSKAPINSPTFTGTVVLPSTTSVGLVTNTEIGYLSGVTSNIQTQFNNIGTLTDFTTALG